MLTKRQKQIFEYLKKFIKERGYSPTLEDIRKHFRLRSKATIHQHLQTLKDRGYISKTENLARGIEIPRDQKLSGLISIPLLGVIAAGEPIEAIENPETIGVPKDQLPKTGKHFALQVSGDSMIDEGIFNGDIVIIKKQQTAENGETVVALINDNEVTLKKIYREKSGFRLQPANPKLKPIYTKELQVQGKVISVFRTFEELRNGTKKVEKRITQNRNEVNTKDTIKKWTNTIQNMNCMEGMKKLPDESIDLIITDPPYGLKKIGLANDCDLTAFYSILPNCYRILKEDAFFIVFFSTKFLPEIFKNNPFQYFWNFVLYCPNGRVSSPIGFTKYMVCVVFKKGNPRMSKRGKDIFVDTPGNLVEPDEGFINHPTPKPKTFIKELLKMFSREDEIVLDPFMGSGSTAIACKQLGRNFIGFEIESKYCNLARTRLKKF